MDTSFQLILNSKFFPIPSKFDRLPKVSNNVYNQLVFNFPHHYRIESNVSDEVLKSFIDYWVKEEIPNINIQNFYEYYYLNQEFDLLTELINQKREEFGQDLQFFNGLLNNDNIRNKSDYEKQIAENLDNYLTKYGTEIMKLPIQTLFNIFNHPNRTLNNHNLAYNLIQIEFNRSHNQNIFILLSSLDATKLSQENLEDSICSHHLRDGMMPKIEHSTFSNFFDKQCQMERQINELQTLSDAQQLKMNEFMGEMESYKSSKDEEINELTKLIENHENEKNELKDLIAAQASEIEQLKKQIEEQKNTYNNEIKIIKESFTNSINQLKNNLQKISSARAKRVVKKNKKQSQPKDDDDVQKNNPSPNNDKKKIQNNDESPKLVAQKQPNVNLHKNVPPPNPKNHKVLPSPTVKKEKTSVDQQAKNELTLEQVLNMFSDSES